ncbi:FA57A protein, partial [Falcunculus frontatus]|nr:FA57A protein [Falcunculus frontatus]
MWRTLALASAFFPGLFILCIRLLRWAAPGWSLKDRILLSGRLVSTVQATMATVSGITVVLSCKNVVHDRHWLAVEYIWVLVPYMTYDIYVMYLCHWHKSQEKGILEKKHSLASVWSFLLQERLMVTHHLFILIVLTPITQVRAAAGAPWTCWVLARGAHCWLSLQHFRGELGDFFVGCIFIAELSTPFVSLGKILMQLKMQDTLLHKVNGILILVTFFLCRILLFPFMYAAYARQVGIPVYLVPFRIPLHCNIANASLIAPQLYWFRLICRKAARLY